MKRNLRSWPQRFVRWLFGSPFRRLPAPFGNTVPSDLQVFEAQADEAAHHGLGGVATTVPAHHATTRPARIDSSLERQ
jgi:hypothetical protein